MKIIVHVKSIADLADARADALAVAGPADEIEVIVAQPVSTPAERQEARPAGGIAANQKG
ncbi:MAG: hypothetical protein ACRCYS_05005 [Beijerinckiaceae bacterium]